VTQIELRSDNAAPTAPEILAAIADANVGTALAYGDDDTTARLHDVVRRVFEHDRARVFPVTSGTAANSLALSAACPPWGAIICHQTAHILNSEANATAMLSGGAQMIGVPGDDHLMTADSVRDALDAVRWGDPHHSQPTVLSFTQPTDMGTVYPLEQLTKVADVARERGLRVHLDGARIANALVHLGCAPADMTWRAGVDIVSLGATKNGGLSAEAIVVFDDAVADELVYRTKRAGHVTSKMRFQSAQLIAYLSDDLWLRLAADSNARMADLAAGLAQLDTVDLVNRPDANMLFVRLSDEHIARLEASGLLFYTIGPGLIRLVTSWATTAADVERTLAAFRDL
jgi:threonine aldolase